MNAKAFRTGFGLLLIAATGVAVARSRVAAAGPDRPVTVVDSVVSREEALRRFREDLPSVATLEGGESSMESLVRAFVAALETRDTAALERMTLSRREFAWVYYDTNPQSRPPYDLNPSLFWFLLEGGNRGGLAKLLDERAGAPMGYRKTRCEGEPSRQGENTVYGPCVLVTRKGEERLFGPIVERGGRWKFVSNSNKLD